MKTVSMPLFDFFWIILKTFEISLYVKIFFLAILSLYIIL